jgi:hypothetical protein
MRPDLPSTFACKAIAADAVLDGHDVNLYGLFVVNAPGVTLTLPPAQETVANRECFVVNNSANSVTIACPTGFPNDLDSITLAAGASVLLYCAPVSGISYRWASVGATAS